ncbi:hypothetical protein [Saccharopolyspora sp. NPDC049357]|uniref:hypothetical protein n=1 Tax=Saccharopolyspora sp. NPDC049357 TaxID=3154507 RepID=UPI00341CA5D1
MSLETRLAAAQRHADRYRELDRRCGSTWQIGDHLRAVALLLGAAANYRAAGAEAANIGDGRARDLAWSAARLSERAEDHELWAELGRIEACGGAQA